MGQMKQVAVRMTDKQHAAAIKAAKRSKVSFGEFVRDAVDQRIEAMKSWIPDSRVSQGSGWIK